MLLTYGGGRALFDCTVFIRAQLSAYYEALRYFQLQKHQSFDGEGMCYEVKNLERGAFGHSTDPNRVCYLVEKHSAHS